MAAPTQTSELQSGWTRRRLALFLLSMSPFIALFVLLAWGQVRSGGNPGNLLEHNQSGEIDVAQRQAPAFEGLDLISGEPIDNAAVVGKIVMVNFWSSWCVACKAEAQELADVYREYDDAPVEFVGLAIWDEVGDTLRHIQRYGVRYPNIIDSRGTRAVTYGVRGVPEKFFLSTDGTILRKINGPLTREQLREIIDSLLAS
jgi:cytochrome c biogenesis protein CcmG/thiol:disulfide interchange protein DsbE